MRISILSDQTELSRQIAGLIRSTAPEVQLAEWDDPEALMRSSNNGWPDMVFIYAGNEDAVTYSERIRYLMPLAGIVILADDDRFAMEALHIHAQGYIIRPATENQIRRELEYYQGLKTALYNSQTEVEEPGHLLEFSSDGADCMIDGTPVRFKRKKTRELMAYLAEKSGSMVDDEEILAELWGCGSESAKSCLRTVKSELYNLFRDAGYEDAVIKHRGRIGLMTDKLPKRITD